MEAPCIEYIVAQLFSCIFARASGFSSWRLDESHQPWKTSMFRHTRHMSALRAYRLVPKAHERLA
jgi:hypothetical protein